MAATLACTISPFLLSMCTSMVPQGAGASKRPSKWCEKSGVSPKRHFSCDISSYVCCSFSEARIHMQVAARTRSSSRRHDTLPQHCRKAMPALCCCSRAHTPCAELNTPCSSCASDQGEPALAEEHAGSELEPLAPLEAQRLVAGEHQDGGTSGMARQTFSFCCCCRNEWSKCSESTRGEP